MDTCFWMHESLVCSPSRLVPQKCSGPRQVGSLGALGEWLLRSLSKGVGSLGAAVDLLQWSRSRGGSCQG